MPVWNGEKYLRSAIDSVLAQDFTEFELIVVDDGSTDATRDILASYSDSRIRVHRLAHKGIVTALNAGVALAQTDWIVRHDADDLCMPDRFLAQWKALHAHTGAVLCYTDVDIIGEGAEQITRARLPRTKAFLALRLCYECAITHSTAIFNKNAFVRAGGYRADERHAEDFGLWGRLIEIGDVVAIPQPLLHLRVHSESVSQGNLERQRALAVKIATDHCRRFLRLAGPSAMRAFAVLSTPQRRWKNWCWFVFYCAPRLRWWSFEAAAWILWQTLKLPLSRTVTSKRVSSLAGRSGCHAG